MNLSFSWNSSSLWFYVVFPKENNLAHTKEKFAKSKALEIKSIPRMEGFSFSFKSQHSIRKVLKSFLLQTMSNIKRVMIYVGPVTLMSFALNIPKFMEVKLWKKSLMVCDNFWPVGDIQSYKWNKWDWYDREEKTPHLHILVHAVSNLASHIDHGNIALHLPCIHEHKDLLWNTAQ